MYNQQHSIGLEDEGTAMLETSRNTNQKKQRHIPKDFHAPTGVWLSAVMLQFSSSKLNSDAGFLDRLRGLLWHNRTRQPMYYNVTLRLIFAVEKQ